MPSNRLFTKDFLAPDPREYDPRLCARFVFNGIGGTTHLSRCGDFNLTAPTDAAGPGVTLQVPSFSRDTQGFTRMTVPASSADLNAREWIADRLKTTNSSLMIGDFESDCYVRVRYDKSTDASSISVPRIGFSQGHITYSPPTDVFDNAACFVSEGARQTWIVVVACNATTDGTTKEIDTGIAIADWHVLGVHCNDGANVVTFTIDGKIVHVEKDPLFIPSRKNLASRGVIRAEGTIDGATVGSGVTLRGRSSASAGNEAKLDIDWIRVRHFFARPR